jgi:ParB family transcriptional regulator, chromosome partitioning protein
MQMTKVQKITLSPSRDIPFNKLVLSQSNVRRVKAGVIRPAILTP